MSTDTFGTEADHPTGAEAADTTESTLDGDGAEESSSDESRSDGARTDESSTDESSSDDSVSDADSPPSVSSDAGASSGGGTGSSRRGALEAEGDIAADFLEALLDICDIVGDIDVDVDGDRAAVSIVDSDDGRVPRRLVGPDGKVLEALQELTRLAVQSETGQRSRLMLDIAGHRAARRAEIVEVARGVIGEVKETANQVELEPMTAFERKIVHDEVLAAGLRSESDGVEPHRFVVVLPAE
ncbi:RNA-binding protein [Nostocoides sp. F2B08]|uniref:Jag family protein n=1 Tax=Nostocoides sp. F2B08 TaxID=2653936 RepID=UPI001263BBDC|nr:R3H domain-containing nucleic acid-binding protein [Tetrasphaera sp. F2B08]KAB7745527.1 RNA-binding protein [Tetrasphaera sp. F2B08]